MATEKLKSIQGHIQKIKTEIGEIKEMRPGTLSRQYNATKSKKYYQLSYTHKMKSRTDYVRSQYVLELRNQVKEYKRFKRLMDKWIDLSIEYSRLKMKN